MGPEILIAGDRAHRGELVPRVQDLGYTVSPVRERELVLRAAQNPSPAAVIVCLGSADAHALVQSLRERPETAGIPVLLYGRLQGETRDLAAVLELGADRFLEAPVDEVELKAALVELAGPPEVEPRPEARGEPSPAPRPDRADPILNRLHHTLAELAARLETREESVDSHRDGIDLEAMGLDAVPDVDPEHDSGELELLREPTQRLPARSTSRDGAGPSVSASRQTTRSELTFSRGEEISQEPPGELLDAHEDHTALIATDAREDVRKDRATRWRTDAGLSQGSWPKRPVRAGSGAPGVEGTVELGREVAAGSAVDGRELSQETEPPRSGEGTVALARGSWPRRGELVPEGAGREVLAEGTGSARARGGELAARKGDEAARPSRGGRFEAGPGGGSELSPEAGTRRPPERAGRFARAFAEDAPADMSQEAEARRPSERVGRFARAFAEDASEDMSQEAGARRPPERGGRFARAFAEDAPEGMSRGAGLARRADRAGEARADGGAGREPEDTTVELPARRWPKRLTADAPELPGMSRRTWPRRPVDGEADKEGTDSAIRHRGREATEELSREAGDRRAVAAREGAAGDGGRGPQTADERGRGRWGGEGARGLADGPARGRDSGPGEARGLVLSDRRGRDAESRAGERGLADGGARERGPGPGEQAQRGLADAGARERGPGERAQRGFEVEPGQARAAERPRRSGGDLRPSSETGDWGDVEARAATTSQPDGDGGLAPLGAPMSTGETDGPALLAELRRERFTGCLQVVAPEAPERRLWWSEGQVVGGASAAARESVLGRLAARGMLSAAHLELVARWGTGDPRRDVERLAHSGLIKPQEMREALREPVRRIVERIAESGAIPWALHPGASPAIAVELGVPLASLIAGGVQRGATLAELRAAVSDDRRPRLSFAGPEALAAELRWPAVATITERFDGQTRVAELVAEAVADEAAVRGVVYVLELLGHLAPEIADPAASLTSLDRQRVRERLRLARESDYFALLGLSRDASRAEVLQAHADLTATFCESLEPDSRLELAAELEELLAALDEARDVLSDDALHSAYLAQIGAQ